jgi:hypothetical protein
MPKDVHTTPPLVGTHRPMENLLLPLSISPLRPSFPLWSAMVSSEPHTDVSHSPPQPPSTKLPPVTARGRDVYQRRVVTDDSSGALTPPLIFPRQPKVSVAAGIPSALCRQSNGCACSPPPFTSLPIAYRTQIAATGFIFARQFIEFVITYSLDRSPNARLVVSYHVRCRMHTQNPRLPAPSTPYRPVLSPSCLIPLSESLLDNHPLPHPPHRPDSHPQRFRHGITGIQFIGSSDSDGYLRPRIGVGRESAALGNISEMQATV